MEQIVPIDEAAGEGPVGAEALAEMERRGLIRRGHAPLAREILDSDPPGKPAGVLRALLDERTGVKRERR